MKKSLLVFALLSLLTADAAAFDRAPGIQGVYANRHLTQARNSISTILGPHHASTLGGRYHARVVDGGWQFNRNVISVEGAPSFEGENSQTMYAGVMFGIFEDWEAGAYFLSFELSPDFEYSNIPVFITKSFMSENFDAGVRLGLLTGDWALNPGVPFVWRASKWGRLEGGTFVPITFDDDETLVGSNTVVRYMHNITPNIYAGAEVSFFAPEFNSLTDSFSVPVGFMAGYTLPFGKRILEFGASFYWDQLLFEGVAGAEVLQVEDFRINAGVTMRQMVF